MSDVRQCAPGATRILGISAYYHDSAAALVVDGALVAAAQEERFSRKKHDARFPEQALRYCLAAAGVRLEVIDAIVFYDKPLLKFDRLLESYLATAPRGFSSFREAIPVWIREKLDLKRMLRRELARIGGVAPEALPRLLFTEHHQSHAASAFYPSPFDEAAVLCMDGVGEWATTSVWHGRGAAIEPLWEVQFPHSLGLLYSAFTYYTGFRVNYGEYKLMGLAPYGEPRYADLIRQHLIDVKDDGTFRLNMEYFDYVTGLRMTNEKFASLFGAPPRAPEAEVTAHTMDVARSIQVVIEDVVLALARTVRRETGSRRLCLAGGVALNCVANARLLREKVFEELWIQPAAGDAGGSVGAALAGWYQYMQRPRTPVETDSMSGAFLGPAFDDHEVETLLAGRGAPHARLEDDALYERVARMLANGKVVGWFQGRMEFGPRALGNRSILGDPRDPRMQSTMNLKIKFRESFRPFAPAVLAERAREFFELDVHSPYMLLVAPVHERLRRAAPKLHSARGLERLRIVRSTLPAITHVDDSARLQTVHLSTNPRFHRLISAFAEITGVPVLVNTSFNVRGEPIVCTPADAYRCFMATDMDALAIGNVLLEKHEQPQAERARAAAVAFEPD